MYARTRRGECQGLRTFGSNLILSGDGFVVRNIQTAGAMCGTALGVSGSNFEITGVLSSDNGIPEDEPHSALEPWADGITLGRCDNGYVHDNDVEENTDIGIVVGGGTNCRVQNNIIRQHSKHAFGGLQIAFFKDESNGGNHAGSTFSGNTIDSFLDKLAFGIIVGMHPWDASVDIPNSGSAVSNQSTGAVVNLAIDGILGGTVNGTTVSGAQGTYGFNCNIAADYTAAHYGGATIQQNPVPVFRLYHGPCTQ